MSEDPIFPKIISFVLTFLAGMFWYSKKKLDDKLEDLEDRMVEVEKRQATFHSMEATQKELKEDMKKAYDLLVELKVEIAERLPKRERSD